MQIEKKTEIIVKTTDGQIINIGDEVIFNADNKCLHGIYKGISTRGAIMFDGVIGKETVTFNVMPKSIDEIVKYADVKIN